MNVYSFDAKRGNNPVKKILIHENNEDMARRQVIHMQRTGRLQDVEVDLGSCRLDEEANEWML